MKKVTFLCIWIFYIACARTNIFADTVIQDIPPNGILINAPGTYIFANDITWNPVSDAAAITIQANNVRLDLRGFTLQSSPTSFKTIGVLAQASTDLQIVNGTIRNMGLFGIECSQCINVSINEIVVNGLNVNDTVNFTEPAGIFAIACINVSVSDCLVKNINVQTASASGIKFDSTVPSSVVKCRIKNLLNRDGVCSGIAHTSCDNILIKSCKIDQITTEFINNLNTSGHTAIGIFPFKSTNIKIAKCDISNVTGCCDDAHGLSLFICANATVKNCNVKNVLDGAGPAQTGAKATGIEVYASAATIMNCFVKNITAINPQDLQAAGYSVAAADGVRFINCQAEKVKVVDANGKENPALGYGVGFGWAPDPRIVLAAVNVLYLNCLAAKCQVGFDSWNHINSTWAYIVSKCNDIPILNQKDGKRTISCDPCSECGCLVTGCLPNPFVITIDNQAKNNIFKHVKELGCGKRQ